MNDKIKQFYQEHKEEIELYALLGAQAVGVCLLVAIVAKAARAQTLQSLHIKDVYNEEGKIIALVINGITYYHK